MYSNYDSNDIEVTEVIQDSTYTRSSKCGGSLLYGNDVKSNVSAGRRTDIVQYQRNKKAITGDQWMNVPVMAPHMPGLSPYMPGLTPDTQVPAQHMQGYSVTVLGPRPDLFCIQCNARGHSLDICKRRPAVESSNVGPNIQRVAPECGNCGDKGHKTSKCRNVNTSGVVVGVICGQCGTIGHSSSGCARVANTSVAFERNVVCSYCKHAGHELNECHALRNKKCDICDDFGHSGKKCPLLSELQKRRNLRDASASWRSTVGVGTVGVSTVGVSTVGVGTIHNTPVQAGEQQKLYLPPFKRTPSNETVENNEMIDEEASQMDDVEGSDSSFASTPEISTDVTHGNTNITRVNSDDVADDWSPIDDDIWNTGNNMFAPIEQNESEDEPKDAAQPMWSRPDLVDWQGW